MVPPEYQSDFVLVNHLRGELLQLGRVYHAFCVFAHQDLQNFRAVVQQTKLRLYLNDVGLPLHPGHSLKLVVLAIESLVLALRLSQYCALLLQEGQIGKRTRKYQPHLPAQHKFPRAPPKHHLFFTLILKSVFAEDTDSCFRVDCAV